MIIGTVKSKDENLVSIVPKVVEKYIKDGHEVLIEAGAGKPANFPDAVYEAAGAKLVSRKDIFTQADLILTFTELDPEEVAIIPKGKTLIGKFNSGIDTYLSEALKASSLRVFDLDLLPRSTIAQSMDVLSALASLSGYKAVLVGANHYGGYFPMMTTSAGTVPPAKVLIIGAGVAGLQAIATARRLGAMVEAFDVRLATKEEVESLGAKFIEVEGATDNKDAGGYAVEQSEEYIKKQKEMIHYAALKADLIITTANIPNRKAPLLVEQKTVESMKAGSVIIDMAAASGGNVALSKNNEVVDVNGVKIIGNSKLYNDLSNQSSTFYSNNLFSFIKHVFKEGIDNLAESEIVTKTMLQQTEVEVA